jgi:uncharacterized PurR-regulated membrane protein YhhQ (DUF165 family)
LDDIIAEIYGYKITRYVILCGFAAQTLFALICQFVLLTPHPSFFKEQLSYAYILDPAFLRIDISGFAAYIIANLVNSYIITRWKVLLKDVIFGYCAAKHLRVPLLCYLQYIHRRSQVK